MGEPYRIAIAGLGTVGSAVIKILQDRSDLIEKRAGRRIEIVAVSARDKNKDRGVALDDYEWCDNPYDMLDGIDAVIELVGGADGVAKSLVEQALEKDIDVVTANKALLAAHGYDLAVAADKSGRSVFYEAAVAGGIPIVKTVREGFAANEIRAVYGILNGTCNYILTVMRETGRAFDDVLAEAQEKGFAEADPTFDIEGVDAAHKLCLLSALAFGVKPGFSNLPVTGISRITAADIDHAEELGFRIKLLGIARRLNGKIIQGVEPCLVPLARTMSAVDGPLNAVYVEGDSVERGLSTGPGAGGGPTASAVVADIIDLARGHALPVFGIPASGLQDAQWGGPADIMSRFYLHVVVLDQPGVLAEITEVMRDQGISLEAVLQRGHDPNNPVSIVMTTHTVTQEAIQMATQTIADKTFVRQSPCLLRIETF